MGLLLPATRGGLHHLRVLVVVRLRGTLVDALDEDVVQLLVQSYLRVLKLRKSVHHDCVVEVFAHHRLKEGEVVRRKLADARI